MNILHWLAMAGLFSSFVKGVRSHHSEQNHLTQQPPAAQFPGAAHSQQQYPAPPPPLPAHPNDYAFLRARWSDLLTGKSHINRTNPLIRDRINGISNNAARWLRRMNPNEGRVYREWPLRAEDDSFRYTYQKLLCIALSYKTPGTAHFSQPEVLKTIIDSLDLVYNTVYNEKLVMHNRNNWFNIQIGAPKSLADICVLLYSGIDRARLQAWSKTMSLHAGVTDNRSLLGWNRAMVSQIHILAGLLVEDATEIRYGIDGLSHPRFGVFKYMQAGGNEGIYEDGSLISHEVYPYAGGYGLSLLCGVVMLTTLLDSTSGPASFRITDPGIAVYYEAVERSFMPVVWSGIMMEHTAGREMTRESEHDWMKGHSLIGHLLVFADSAPEPYATKYKRLAKLWVAQSPHSYVEAAPLAPLSLWLDLDADTSILPAEPLNGTYITPLQDRIMHHSPAGWCLTTASASTRTGRAEYLNLENENCWFQGDGFSYLYLPNDREHFRNDWWPTLDPYHLPGVTNSMSEPHVKLYKQRALRDWSGGLAFAHNLGAASLDHFSADRLSAAKKSWFFIDEGIVCLGAGINGKSGAEIHTTIESRNLPGVEFHPPLLVDGRLLDCSSPAPISANYAVIPDVAAYLFFGPCTITFHRETRTGRWSDINKQGDNAKNTEMRTRTYQHIIHNHGVDPKGASYAYAILPMADGKVAAKIVAQPVFEVLSNTESLQAISYSSSLGGRVVYATFWKPGTLENMVVKQACMVIWSEERVTVVDPSMKTPLVEIEVKGLGRVVRCNEGVKDLGSGKFGFILKEGQHKCVEFDKAYASGSSHGSWEVVEHNEL